MSRYERANLPKIGTSLMDRKVASVIGSPGGSRLDLAYEASNGHTNLKPMSISTEAKIGRRTYSGIFALK